MSCGDAAIREFLIGRDFVGVHPWRSEEVRIENDEWLDDLRAQLNVSSNSAASSHSQFSILTSKFPPGIGEIGLDRLKEREISPKMRAVFVAQLALAAEFRRPVVLHGAKCWGQVVEEIKKYFSGVPTAKKNCRTDKLSGLLHCQTDGRASEAVDMSETNGLKMMPC